MADLAAKGSTVAIAAFEDPVYDFYLLKVTSDGVEELEEQLTDDYSCHYPSGSAVLKGHFFLRENLQDMTYTLDTKRLAVVIAACFTAYDSLPFNMMSTMILALSKFTLINLNNLSLSKGRGQNMRKIILWLDCEKVPKGRAYVALLIF